MSNYVPRPFEPEAWEYIGGQTAPIGFLPLDLAFLDGERGSFSLLQAGETEEGKSQSGKPAGLSASVQKLIDEAFEAGTAAGREEAKGIAEKKAAEVLVQATKRVAGLGDALKGAIEEMLAIAEKQAVLLALQVAKKILLTTAEVRPEYIGEVLSKGIAAIGSKDSFKIRLSPEDYEFVRVVGLDQELSKIEGHMEFVADDAIKSGVVVESEFGHVDLQLESMWQQVKESIFEGQGR